jgi:hypothetical protein
MRQRSPPLLNRNSNLRLGIRDQVKDFRQALSQVKYYMIVNRTRYGFILTNRELVAI